MTADRRALSTEASAKVDALLELAAELDYAHKHALWHSALKLCSKAAAICHALAAELEQQEKPT